MRSTRNTYVSYRRLMPATLASQRPGLDDQIVKWCSGAACRPNWCVSLDIAFMLAISIDVSTGTRPIRLSLFSTFALLESLSFRFDCFKPRI